MGGGMIPKFDLRRYIFKCDAGGLQKFLEAGETRTNSQKMPLKTRKVQVLMNDNVGCRFQDFAFLPLLGEMIQSD